MSGIFTQGPANRRRYGVAVFVGIVSGIISAFVKWGCRASIFLLDRDALINNKFLVQQIVMNVSQIAVVFGVSSVLNVDYVIKRFVVNWFSF
ncbi:hypothetical protein [Haemophilus haemolyticus]|uniref:hypothetical protein n=1 Tax=Haemophilus haemolyticus TaxID=726 RepID=UPI000E5907C4|nr:hypothetical protein [Haemophilus haemolyticus]